MVYVYPGKYVHLKRRNLGKRTTLHPNEDFHPFGVSFAPSIKQALNAIPLFYTDEDNFVPCAELPRRYWERKYTLYVYTPTRKYEAVTPYEAGDVGASGERRVLGDVEVKLIGKVVVLSKESEKGRKIHEMSIANRRDKWED